MQRVKFANFYRLLSSVVESCLRLCSGILVPDGIEEGKLQHMVSDINFFESLLQRICDVHPKKTTLDITVNFLLDWGCVVPVHEWGIRFNILTCVSRPNDWLKNHTSSLNRHHACMKSIIEVEIATNRLLRIINSNLLLLWSFKLMGGNL